MDKGCILFDSPNTCAAMHRNMLKRLSIQIRIIKKLIQLLFQIFVFGALRCIQQTEVVFLNWDVFIEPQNVIRGNPIDDFCRRQTIDLLRKDMVQPFAVIREEPLHGFAVIEPLYDFRYIQAGLHIHIDEGIIGVIETPWVLPLQHIDHFLYNHFRCKDLVRLLRRNVVEDVLFLGLIKIVRQIPLLLEKFLNGIIEYLLIKQVSLKYLNLFLLRIEIRPAVPQETELLRCNTCHLLKYLVRNDDVEVFQNSIFISISHQEGVIRYNRNEKAEGTYVLSAKLWPVPREGIDPFSNARIAHSISFWERLCKVSKSESPQRPKSLCVALFTDMGPETIP